MKFSGTVKSERIDDDHIKLLEPFWFIDKRGVKWEAPKDFISDGATLKMFKYIPGVGHPLDGDFLEASIIHDYYCSPESGRPRSQKDTHRAFREALKLDGVNWFKRQAMWLAVRSYNRLKPSNWKWK